jgi:P-type conjugative transfer protein TrbJ
VVGARNRLDMSMAAYRQTIAVQARGVDNIAGDQTALAGIVQRSQEVEGALQVPQATNQLLALLAKQQFQIQTLMAAQYRAHAIERANSNQSRGDAQSAAAKFLGLGSAYTPR